MDRLWNVLAPAPDIRRPATKEPGIVRITALVGLALGGTTFQFLSILNAIGTP